MFLSALVVTAQAAEVVWVEPPTDTWRASVAALAHASGPALSPVDLCAAATRWTAEDDEALRRVDAALAQARTYETQLDGELLILRDLEGPVTGVTALRDPADRGKLFAALAYQGFAANRYFGDQLGTDEAAAPWRSEVNGQPVERNLAADDDLLVWSADVDVLDDGELTLAIAFRDAGGALLHTEESVVMVEQGSHVVAINGTRPSNATTASVQIRFREPALGLAVLQVRVQGVAQQERTCAQQADLVEAMHRIRCEMRTNEVAAFFYDGECFGIERPSGCQVLCAEQCKVLSVIPPAPSVCQ
ncbi:MAG: hypothetical protein KC621_07465 [Myxococcales bacterium]|nr:hypothetical protein [Myxococcales bacterium]